MEGKAGVLFAARAARQLVCFCPGKLCLPARSPHMSVFHDRLCELGLWKLFIVFCLQAELVLAAFAICFISAYLLYPIRREHMKLMELLGCLHSSAFF